MIKFALKQLYFVRVIIVNFNLNLIVFKVIYKFV